MEYRNFPQRKFAMSKISLGTVTFGSSLDERACFRILDKAVELGINSFDTAELYPAPLFAEHYGVAESIMGRWLKTKKRDEIFISSKVTGPEDAADYPIAPWVRGSNRRCDRVNIRTAVEGSLQRLGTDYLDLYMTHWPERKVSLNEQVTSFIELIGEGKIKSWGTSNEGPVNMPKLIDFCKSNNKTLPAAQQLLINLLHRDFEQNGMKAHCLENNIAMVAFSPLSMGALTGKYNKGYDVPQGRISQWPERYKNIFAHEQAIAAAKEYESLAGDFGLSLIELSLAWLMEQPVTSILLGVSRENQLDELINACQKRLPMEALNQVNLLHKRIGNPVKGIR